MTRRCWGGCHETDSADGARLAHACGRSRRRRGTADQGAATSSWCRRIAGPILYRRRCGCRRATSSSRPGPRGPTDRRRRHFGGHLAILAMGPFVLGAEADLSWIDIKATGVTGSLRGKMDLDESRLRAATPSSAIRLYRGRRHRIHAIPRHTVTGAGSGSQTAAGFIRRRRKFEAMLNRNWRGRSGSDSSPTCRSSVWYSAGSGSWWLAELHRASGPQPSIRSHDPLPGHAVTDGRLQ